MSLLWLILDFRDTLDLENMTHTHTHRCTDTHQGPNGPCLCVSVKPDQLNPCSSGSSGSDGVRLLYHFFFSPQTSFQCYRLPFFPPSWSFFSLSLCRLSELCLLEISTSFLFSSPCHTPLSLKKQSLPHKNTCTSLRCVRSAGCSAQHSTASNVGLASLL